MKSACAGSAVRCTWRSISPGSSERPAASITGSPPPGGGAEPVDPTQVIRLPSTRTAAARRGSAPVPSHSTAFVISTSLCRASISPRAIHGGGVLEQLVQSDLALGCAGAHLGFERAADRLLDLGPGEALTRVKQAIPVSAGERVKQAPLGARLGLE